MNDIDFISHIVSEICDYAINNKMKPNKTLKIIAENILKLLTFCNFDNWEENIK